MSRVYSRVLQRTSRKHTATDVIVKGILLGPWITLKTPRGAMMGDSEHELVVKTTQRRFEQLKFIVEV